MLINGLFADLSSYDGACFYLRPHFEILRYDCRGQGQSDKPKEIYNLVNHVNDLENLLLIELKRTKVILIGISNGGRIALEFARRFPQHVKAVVACDTYDLPTPMMRAKLGSWLEAYRVGGGQHRFDVATPWIWGEETFNSKSELLLSYRDKADLLPQHVVEGLILGAMETEIKCEEISTPVLLVCGEEDLLTPPFLHQKMLKKLLNGHFKMAEGGHASMIEKPKIMDQIILPWIKLL